MTDVSKKIVLDSAVVVKKRIRNKKWRTLSEKLPFLEKLCYRLPQKAQDRIFAEYYTVTERIFEKAFSLIQIGNYAARIESILDVGCCFSSLGIELATLGFKVTGLDVNDYYLVHSNFFFVKGDLRFAPFSDGVFDLVTAISAVEHIGLGHYGDIRDEEGDTRAVREIRRLLKPGGLFILTVPFGRKQTAPFFRVYDEAAISWLVQGFHILEARYFIEQEEISWMAASKEAAAQQELNARGRNTGNVCLLLQT